MKTNSLKTIRFVLILAFGATLALTGCSPKNGGKSGNVIGENVASKVYVPPGKHDQFYAFMSGGFSGQVTVYGLPSGRLFKIIPVFSEYPMDGYGFSEETKPMLNTTYGFIPWGDAHHPELSQTKGVPDGRWLFINENMTPRIARIDLKIFRTTEILQIPNTSGCHASPFCTQNTEYLIANTRFSVPEPYGIKGNQDVPITSYKKNFKGIASFIKVDPKRGHMSLAFQIEEPGFDWDIGHCGKGPSKDWAFYSCYNSEEAHTMLEVNASQNDKDFLLAINWKKAAEYVKEGKAKIWHTPYDHNIYNKSTQTAHTEVMHSEKILMAKDCPGMMYLMPCPKSPHGVDIDPTGEYIVASGKLSTIIPVFSFKKMQKAIQNKSYAGNIEGIPVLKYDQVIAGEVKKPGLGPLHTEFDDKGNAYSTMFISSEIIKWKVSTQQIEDRHPVYYSPGHLMIPGGDSRKPWGKYLVSLNKITKDRFLPTGPELCQAAQLFDISGDKMKLLLDFPTNGEPHYAQAIPASIVAPHSQRIYKLEDNKNPYAVKSEKETRIVRHGKRVDAYLSVIRSHFCPDNIEGIHMGDTVYFHVTNLEQDWDIPHGFAVQGNLNSELLIMPGQTRSLKWIPNYVGIVPFDCTDFCSALHQEMQGYVRVSPEGSNVPLKWGLDDDWKTPSTYKK